MRANAKLRTHLFTSTAIVLIVAGGVLSGHAQEASAEAAVSAEVVPFERDQTDAAVDKAIDYLVSQQRGDGAITDRGHETTMTSLAIMAMASVGVQPADPDSRGQAMRKALAYVLQDDRQNKEGYFGDRDGSRMYGHGITTLMLTELLGMGVDTEQDRQIHERCQKAIDLILSSQKVKKPLQYQGGWRYYPTANDADLSVTIWQLMALRSAKNDGLQVPATAIRDAVEYLKRSYASTLDHNGMPDKKASGFSYTPTGRSPTYTMTSAGCWPCRSAASTNRRWSPVRPIGCWNIRPSGKNISSSTARTTTRKACINGAAITRRLPVNSCRRSCSTSSKATVPGRRNGGRKTVWGRSMRRRWPC